MKKTFFCIFTLFACAGLFAQQPGKTYNIGDVGPAGGIVFYDKGVFSDNWRYMEAAPVDAGIPVPTAQWGLWGVTVKGTSDEIGMGKNNTKLIVAEMKQNGEKGKAAQLCDDYSLNGYSDWFLPSLNELNQLYLNLKQKDFGNLGNFWYWSSTEATGKNAWSRTFVHPSKYSGNAGMTRPEKTMPFHVRPIRYF
ncbi:MAG: DUF1566 domain-containing protein [Treponema sp.]|jgi:hypothetical protein|nr:DUF1566 domain-containing protein [Treponema sp.]